MPVAVLPVAVMPCWRKGPPHCLILRLGLLNWGLVLLAESTVVLGR